MDCKNCFEIIINGQFGKWMGLPEDCELSTFQNYFKLVSDHRGSGFLGKKNERTFFVISNEINYAKTIRAWITPNYYLKMIEIEYPMDLSVTHLDEKLDKPDHLANYYLRDIVIEGGEYVYNEKGLSVLYNSDKSKIYKILLYPPSSYDKYRDHLHFSQRSREFKTE